MTSLKIVYRGNSSPTVIQLKDYEIAKKAYRDILDARLGHKRLHVLSSIHAESFIDVSEIVECSVVTD